MVVVMSNCLSDGNHKLTQVLQVNADLVHPSGKRFAQHHTRVAVEADLLEGRLAVLSARRHFQALIWLLTTSIGSLHSTMPLQERGRWGGRMSSHSNRERICHLLWELALHPTHVLLLHLSVPDLVLHLACHLGAATEEQQAGR